MFYICVLYSSLNMPSFLFETNNIHAERIIHEERVH